jgi:hypothetical protein
MACGQHDKQKPNAPPSRRLSPELLLEGTRLTWKTELAGSMPFVVEIANGSTRYATFSRVPFAWTSNAARKDVGRAGNQVADWLEQTGGLWAT